MVLYCTQLYIKKRDCSSYANNKIERLREDHTVCSLLLHVGTPGQLLQKVWRFFGFAIEKGIYF